MVLCLISVGAGALPLQTRLPVREAGSEAWALSSAAQRSGPRAALASTGLQRRLPWGQWPMAFEPAGRDHQASVAKGPGYVVRVSSAGAWLALRRPGIDRGDLRRPSTQDREMAGPRQAASAVNVGVRFVDARPSAPAEREAPLPGRVHRLLGSDPRQWETQLPTHARVRYREVYPGVDLVYYGRGRELEFDFVLAPGVSAQGLRLAFDGVECLQVDGEGNLELATEAGTLIQRAPVAYQEGDAGPVAVDVGYEVGGDGSVGFALGAYDRSRPLVIDPVLSYSTFLGGPDFDQCWAVAVDATGAAFVTGETESALFDDTRVISTNGLFTEYQGGQINVAGDAFVAKLLPDGTAFEWFTYLGGSDLETAYTIALSAAGEPVVGGFTTSTNYPLSTNAFQRELQGETNRFTGRKPLEAFVTRLTADGSGVVSSTLFGGGGEEQVIDLALLADGRVVAVGTTTSTNLPVPGPGAQKANGGGTDAFLALLAADGSAVLAATYLGGEGRDSAEGVVVDAAEVAHVIGITASTNFPVVAARQSTNAGLSDAFAAGLRLGDGAVVYATYLGGASDDYAYRAALDPGGDVWMVGETLSLDFPVATPLQGTNAGGSDGFVARLSPDGATLVLSTYLGGESADAIWDGQTDAAGNLYLAGETFSTALTGVTTNSLQPTNAGLADLLIARLGTNGTLSATFFGSPGEELAYGVDVDAAGGMYLVGRSRSVVFPVSSTNVAQATFGGGLADGFVAKLAEIPALTAARVADLVEVSWPSPNPGYVLEQAAGVEGEETWTPVEQPATVRDARHVVELPAAVGQGVFRLRSRQ